MDPIYEIELEDCPVCRGVGAMQEEQGWCVYVACMDCGAETAHSAYSTPEERLEAARQAAKLWNMGKVIHTAASE
ncbi:MAG: Lar family restriction alleviation protein [Clostridia bacterium]|nr:Lar family restriction alleviation protein [Clostridia bacterium]